MCPGGRVCRDCDRAGIGTGDWPTFPLRVVDRWIVQLAVLRKAVVRRHVRLCGSGVWDPRCVVGPEARHGQRPA